MQQYQPYYPCVLRLALLCGTCALALAQGTTPLFGTFKQYISWEQNCCKAASPAQHESANKGVAVVGQGRATLQSPLGSQQAASLAVVPDSSRVAEPWCSTYHRCMHLRHLCPLECARLRKFLQNAPAEFKSDDAEFNSDNSGSGSGGCHPRRPHHPWWPWQQPEPSASPSQQQHGPGRPTSAWAVPGPWGDASACRAATPRGRHCACAPRHSGRSRRGAPHCDGVCSSGTAGAPSAAQSAPAARGGHIPASRTRLAGSSACSGRSTAAYSSGSPGRGSSAGACIPSTDTSGCASSSSGRARAAESGPQPDNGGRHALPQGTLPVAL